MVVRCTAKALKLLGTPRSSLTTIEPASEDWYLNLLWLERRKCLLLVHAATVFSIFIPDVGVHDLDPLGPFLVKTMRAALDAEQLPHWTLGSLDAANVRLAATASRRTLGFMNDIALHIQHALARSPGLRELDVDALNHQLQRTLHHHDGRYVVPLELARERARDTT